MVTGNYEEDFEDVTESLYVDDSRQVSVRLYCTPWWLEWKIEPWLVY